MLVRQVASVCGAPVELVDRTLLEMAVRGKYVPTVFEETERFAGDSAALGLPRIKTPQQRIGILVKRLKALPLRDSDPAYARDVGYFDVKRSD